MKDKPKWVVDYEPDGLDSSKSRLHVIDASEASMSHPQGPITIATVNVAAFAPHIEHALEHAKILASAPDFIEAAELFKSFLESLPKGWLGKTTGDIGLLNDAYIALGHARAKRNAALQQ